MKAKFDSLVFLFGIFFTAVVGNAQEIIRKTKGGERYVVNQKSGIVHKETMEEKECESTLFRDYDVLPNSILSSTIQRVLEMEKIEKNKYLRINCLFECTPEAQIESVWFSFPENNVFLSVDEVAELERALMAEKFPIKLYNKDIKSISFAQCCFFYRFFE